MKDALAILGIIGGIIAVITTIAGAVVLARAAYAKAQMEQLRTHNTDLTERQSYLTQELMRLQGEKKAAEAARDVAIEMVTQRADLEAHHAQVMKNHQRLFGLLDFITRLIEEVLTHVGKRA